MRRIFFCLLTLPFTPLLAQENEDHLSRRISAHLAIKDAPAAVLEAKNALLLYPNSPLIYAGTIKALAEIGDEQQMMRVWEKFAKLDKDKANDRELIEAMGWGILQKVSKSPSLVLREMSHIAALFSQDAKGITILFEGMRDPNHAVRTQAVKLAGHCRDQRLVDEVQRLFATEKIWSVRLQLIKAIGGMKITSMQSELEALIASPETSLTEKKSAINALLELQDDIDPERIRELSESNRRGLRELACHLAAHFQCHAAVTYLMRLTKDPHSEVRAAAFQALADLNPKEHSADLLLLALKGCKEANDPSSLSAAYLLALLDKDKARETFQKALFGPRKETRWLAAAVLSSTGGHGIDQLVRAFHTSDDPLVRLNLAFGMIGQGQETKAAASLIQEVLLSDTPLSVHHTGKFRVITSLPQEEGAEFPPEVENQMLRLELLNLLFILKASGAQETLVRFLNSYSTEISAMATALLLSEGDETAVDAIKGLLENPKAKIRLQAALILSMWSREESAIQTLEEEYPKSDTELKARLLEGMGRIGAMRSVPFLLKQLNEPSETLRLIAAIALIQCLNH